MKKKILMPLSLLVLAGVMVGVVSVLNQPNIAPEDSEAATGRLDYGFEDATLPSTIQDFNIEVKGNNTISAGTGQNGSNALLVNSDGSLSTVNFKSIQLVENTVITVNVYDAYGEKQAGAPGISVANEDASKYVLIEFSTDGKLYLRTPEQRVDIGLKRSNGWHKIEFFVTKYGTYAQIDGISYIEKNYSTTLTNASILSLGATWTAGRTYYDNVSMATIRVSNQPSDAMTDYNTLKELSRRYSFVYGDMYKDSYFKGYGVLGIAGDGKLNTYDVWNTNPKATEVKVNFYDRNSAEDTFAISIASVTISSNSKPRNLINDIESSSYTIKDYMILEARKGIKEYMGRNNTNATTTNVGRSKGWHELKFVSGEKGFEMYLDQVKLDMVGVNAGLLDNINIISLGNTGVEGSLVLFDELSANFYNSPPTPPTSMMTGFEDANVYDEFNPAIAEVQTKGNKELISWRHFDKSENSLIIRGLMNYNAQLIADDLNRPNSTQNKELIIANFKYAVAQYPNWGKTRLSPVPVKEMMAYSEFYLQELPSDLLADIDKLVQDESAYWVTIFKQVRNNPAGKNLPNDLKEWMPNLANVSIIGSSDVNSYTRADENASIADLLLSAGNKYNQSEFKEYGNCYLDHVFSKNTTACGITTSNVDTNNVIAEFNTKPNPVYAVAALYSLQDAGYYLRSHGGEIPEEIKAVMDGGYLTHPVYVNTTKDCVDANLVINASCGGGKEWGERVYMTKLYLDIFDKNRIDGVITDLDKINRLTYMEKAIVVPASMKVIDLSNYTDFKMWYYRQDRMQQLVARYGLYQQR